MPKSRFHLRQPSIDSSESAVYVSSAPYSRRTTLLMSEDAASGWGSGPGSTSRTACPRFRSSIAAVTPKMPAPTTRVRSMDPDLPLYTFPDGLGILLFHRRPREQLARSVRRRPASVAPASRCYVLARARPCSDDPFRPDRPGGAARPRPRGGSRRPRDARPGAAGRLALGVPDVDRALVAGLARDGARAAPP